MPYAKKDIEEESKISPIKKARTSKYLFFIF